MNNTDLERAQEMASNRRRRKELRQDIMDYLISRKGKTPEHARKIIWRYMAKARVHGQEDMQALEELAGTLLHGDTDHGREVDA